MSKYVLLTAIFCLAIFQWGCVSSGTYELKVDEAARLNQNLTELQQKYADLTLENSDLKAQVEILTSDLAARTGERDRLSVSNTGLQESLKSTADSKNQKITEMTQKVSDLEKENARLKDEIVTLRKVKEAEVLKTSRTYEEMLEKMKTEISRGEVTISELMGKLTVNMLNSILFDSGKAEVKREGLEVLQKVVDILKNVKDKMIRIEGHTDNVQIIGELTRKYPTNWELSSARAVNVARYLQSQGINPDLLSAVAYGEFKPVAANDNEEGKRKNRRIEIILVAKE